MVAVAASTCISSKLKGLDLFEMGRRLSTHTYSGKGDSSSTCAEHLGEEFLETLSEVRLKVSITYCHTYCLWASISKKHLNEGDTTLEM